MSAIHGPYALSSLAQQRSQTLSDKHFQGSITKAALLALTAVIFTFATAALLVLPFTLSTACTLSTGVFLTLATIQGAISFIESDLKWRENQVERDQEAYYKGLNVIADYEYQEACIKGDILKCLTVLSSNGGHRLDPMQVLYANSDINDFELELLLRRCEYKEEALRAFVAQSSSVYQKIIEKVKTLRPNLKESAKTF